MAHILDVHLLGDLVGQLIQADDGQMVFGYAASWLENPDAVPLSYSLPLRKERFLQNECRGFFGGLLPEEISRKVVARILGISDKNDFAMLEQIGGECAGAVTFLPAGTSFLDADYRYRNLTDDELVKILRELPTRPLMAGEDGVRLSLAGAQDKIAVRIENDEIMLPLGTAPSTHILKPAIATYEGVVFNEAFCMSLAASVGLSVAKTDIGSIEDIDYLLIERFDRYVDEDGSIHRLHQEDFCQALGIASEIKYESEGGPGINDCFDLLRLASRAPVVDLAALFDAVIFNLVIGNHDAHAKNFAFLCQTDKTRVLAPLYDLVCTVFYPELTDKMAMRIGGEAKSDLVFPNNFEKFAEVAGLAKPLVQLRVTELTKAVLDSASKVERRHSISEQVADVVRKRCENILLRFGD